MQMIKFILKPWKMTLNGSLFDLFALCTIVEIYILIRFHKQAFFFQVSVFWLKNSTLFFNFITILPILLKKNFFIAYEFFKIEMKQQNFAKIKSTASPRKKSNFIVY